MRGVYTVAQIQAAEHRAFNALVDGTLMQRAATALAYQCIARLHSDGLKIYGSSIVLLVGSGSNGGDALFAGAQLARRGAVVTAVLVDTSRRCHEGGSAAFAGAGGKTFDGEPSDAISLVQDADLVVDGIVGIGARPGLSSVVGTDQAAINVTTIAVDVPSGISADTGVVDEVAVRADITVTFGGLKPGLLIGRGAELAGEIHLVDIDSTWVWIRETTLTRHVIVLESKDVVGWLPRPEVLTTNTVAA